MAADRAPLQPDLPFDLEPQAPTAVPKQPAGDAPEPPPDAKPSRPAWRPRLVEETPPPPLTQQLLERLHALPWPRWRGLGGRSLPWSRWRGVGGRALQGSRGFRAAGARILRLSAGAAAAAITRVAPYAATLARNTARAGLLRAILRLGATAIHVAGFPGVVMRTALQFTVVHRAGLTVESVTYFEARDPAGYVVYQAPQELGTALAVTFLPTVILIALAVVCLAPALTPRAVLHLHRGLLTWLEIWIGLAFAAHALPNLEEAAPTADQARAGVGKAEPLALLMIIPAQVVAWVTRFGGLAPGVLGVAFALWLSSIIFR